MNPHLEGAAVLGFSLFAYHWNHGSWLLFALLFLLPDVSMVGYLANARAGAAIYNAIHTCVGPLLLAGYSVGTAHHTTLLLVSDLGGAYRLRPTAWVRPEVSDTFQGHTSGPRASRRPMTNILLFVVVAAVLVVGFFFYRSHFSGNRLLVDTHAAQEIEKAKRR